MFKFVHLKLILLRDLFISQMRENLRIYPATVVRNDKIVAMASENIKFDVKTTLKSKKLETIRDILAMGNIDDII